MATETEKMIIAASRSMPKDTAVFVGTGMPLLASVLALIVRTRHTTRL